MKTMTFHTLSAVLLALSFGSAACDPQEPGGPASAEPDAQGLRLLPPAAGDLAAPELVADAPPPAREVDRAAVTVSWPIEQSADDLAAPPVRPPDSRAYWQRVAPAELAAGVPLPISEPGALLKLSAADGSAVPLDALELVDAGGAVLRGDDALRPLADPTHLADAGAPFPPGTAVYGLRSDLGVGAFTLRGEASAPVLIYVLERKSGAALSLAPASDVVFVGAPVRVAARLRDGDAVLKATSIAGELIAPDGTTAPITLTLAGDGGYVGEIPAPPRAVPAGSLYTLQVQAAGANIGGLTVRRTATSAVALSFPTARFSGRAEVEPLAGGGVRARLGVEVGAASRFGVGAVLHGTNRDGEMQPIGVGQSAQWLEPGARELTLEFDAATLTAGGMRAPFELRDLRLLDQGRVSVLHRQARALAMPGRDD